MAALALALSPAQEWAYAGTSLSTTARLPPPTLLRQTGRFATFVSKHGPNVIILTPVLPRPQTKL